MKISSGASTRRESRPRRLSRNVSARGRYKLRQLSMVADSILRTTWTSTRTTTPLKEATKTYFRAMIMPHQVMQATLLARVGKTRPVLTGTRACKMIWSRTSSKSRETTIRMPLDTDNSRWSRTDRGKERPNKVRIRCRAAPRSTNTTNYSRKMDN